MIEFQSAHCAHDAADPPIEADSAVALHAPAENAIAPASPVITGTVFPDQARISWRRIVAIAASLCLHVALAATLVHTSLPKPQVAVGVSEVDALVVEWLISSESSPTAVLPSPSVLAERVTRHPRRERTPTIPKTAKIEPLPEALAIEVVPMPQPAPDAAAVTETLNVDPAPSPAATDKMAQQPQAAAVEAPLSARGKRARTQYLRELMAWLARHRVYPAEARKGKLEGVVQVRFAIRRDGQLLSATVHRSAGTNILDQAALEVLHRANPMPAFPKALDRQRLSITLPIDFSLITH